MKRPSPLLLGPLAALLGCSEPAPRTEPPPTTSPAPSAPTPEASTAPASAPRASTAPTSAPSPLEGPEEPAPLGKASLEQLEIKKLAEYSYEIDASRLAGALTLDDFSSQARVVPHMRDGEVKGMKLFSIRPDSVFARLGFLNGDVVAAIDGAPVTGVESVMTQTGKWSRATKMIRVDVLRRDLPVTLVYSIR